MAGERPPGLGGPLRVGVAGCGLIGGSILLGLAGHSELHCHGFDPDPRTRGALAGLGVEVHDDVADLAGACDLVVVACPPDATPQLVAEALAASTSVVVTDVASVKVPVIAALAGRAPEEALGRFVPGHPLAGRERHGLDAAASDLFSGAVWAICPAPGQPLDVVLLVCRLAWALGAAVLAVDPGAHDEAVAYSSHGPHLVANALARATPPDRRRLAAMLSGGGLRDATRVAASDTDLWREIIASNRQATLDAIRAHRAALDEMERIVDAHDWTAFAERWEDGRAATRELRAARWEYRRWTTVVLPDTDSDALLRLGRAGQLLRSARVDPGGTAVEASIPDRDAD